MAHIAEHILSNLSQRDRGILISAVNEFEQEAAAPVRVLKPNAGRTATRSLSNWLGDSSRMNQYPGFMEEDCETKGITILTSSYNSEAHVSPPNYNYLHLPNDVFANYVADTEVEVHTPNMTTGHIEAAGGISLWCVYNDVTYVYGEIYENGRVSFLPMSFESCFVYGDLDFSALLFNAILDNASDEARAAALIRRESIQREIFTRMMEDQGNIIITDLRNKIAETSSTIGETEVQLTNARFDANQMGQQLAHLIEDQGTLSTEEINEEWDAIQKHTSVKSFFLGKSSNDQEGETARQCRRREERGESVDRTSELGAYLQLRTELLWIEHPETGRKIPLGEFEISMKFGNNVLSIKNLSNSQGRWDHPHVESNMLCAADYGSTITTLLRERKLSSLTGIVFSILKTLTMTDITAVNNMKLWEEDDDRKRRENDWPAWSSTEVEHPLLLEEADNDSDEDEE